VPLKRSRGGPFSSARAFPLSLSRAPPLLSSPLFFVASGATGKSLSPIFLASLRRSSARLFLSRAKAFLRRPPLRILCTRPARARGYFIRRMLFSGVEFSAARFVSCLAARY